MILKEIWYPKDFIIFRKKNNKLTLLRLNYLKEFEQVIANIYNYSGFYTRNNKIKVPSNSIGDFINLTNQFNISVGLISENMFKKIKHLEFANNHNYFKYTLKKSSHSFEEYCYIIYLFKHKLKITPYANGVISLLLNYLGYKEKICPFFILQKRIRMQFYFFLYIFIFKYILKAIEIIFFYFACKYIYFFEKIQNIQIFPKLVYFLFLMFSV